MKMNDQSKPPSGLTPYRRAMMQPANPSLDVARDADFTWEQAVRILRKNSRFALAIAGAIAAATVLLALMIRDVYKPVARLDLEPPAGGIKPFHEIESAAPAQDQDYLETQVQILKSDALAVSVIRDLHLTANSGAGAKKEGIAPPDSLGGQPGAAAVTSPYVREQLSLATLSPAEAATLETFRKNLTVGVVRNTRLVEVGYSSHAPGEAQRVTNAVVSKFIDSSFKHRYTTTMQVSEWLSSQLTDLRQRLEASNQAVSDYQRKYGLVELDDRDVPMSQLMSEVNHQLSEAQANRIENEAFVRMINLGETDSVPVVHNDLVYQNLMTRYADLRGQLAQAKTVYGDANSNVKKLEEQTGEIARQISAEEGRIADRLRTSYHAAQEREKLMLQSREKLRKQMGNVSSQLVGYHLLKNEAMANAELYNTLQGRLQEAGIYAGLKSSNVRIVDLATNLQKPTGPNRALIISGGLLLACVFGVLGCFVKESFDNTVRTPDDVKAWSGLRSLAMLPALSADNQRSYRTSFGGMLPLKRPDGTQAFEFMEPASAGAEGIRDLRTSLLSPRADSVPAVILISSATEGEGKSTIAANFALSLAQLGRTCLVDGDLRRPAVTQAFGLLESVGLSDVLNGTSLAAGLSQSKLDQNLWIVPAGQVKDSPADLLASRRIDEVCEELKRTFQFVVIDSPPVIRFSDARSLSRLADDVVLVGRYGITTRRAIQRSAELLREAQAPVAGFVLNGIDQSSSDYHYFSYGYSKSLSEDDKRKPGDQDRPLSKGAHA